MSTAVEAPVPRAVSTHRFQVEGGGREVLRGRGDAARYVRTIRCAWCGLRRIDPRDAKRAGQPFKRCPGKPKWGGRS